MNSWPLDRSVSIVLVALAIIAITLFAMGSLKTNRMLRTLGISLYVVFAVCLFIFWTDLREIITAFAAVAAAIIAAISIYQSRQMRQESIERESRDRKERLVNEVTNWLRELESHVFPKPRTIRSVADDTLLRDPEISRETYARLLELDLALTDMNALSEGIKEAEYYRKLTSNLNEQLSSLIEVIVNNLEQRRQLVIEQSESPLGHGEMEKESQLIEELIENEDRPLEGLDLSDQAILSVRLTRNAHAIRKSILNAVDRAIELKTSLIQVP